MAKRRARIGSGQSRSSGNGRLEKIRRMAEEISKRIRKSSSGRTRPTGGSNGQRTEEPPKPLVRTTLSAEALDYFKELLLQKRRELVGDVGSLESEALGKNRTAAAGDLSMMPIHMADIGTDNYEQEFSIGLMESEREILKEIDAALDRIREGTYGMCQATQKPILQERLKAMPWARYCVHYKRVQEEGRQG